jgi:hypothetical protein
MSITDIYLIIIVLLIITFVASITSCSIRYLDKRRAEDEHETKTTD